MPIRMIEIAADDDVWSQELSLQRAPETLQRPQLRAETNEILYPEIGVRRCSEQAYCFAALEELYNNKCWICRASSDLTL